MRHVIRRQERKSGWLLIAVILGGLLSLTGCASSPVPVTYDGFLSAPLLRPIERGEQPFYYVNTTNTYVSSSRRCNDEAGAASNSDDEVRQQLDDREINKKYMRRRFQQEIDESYRFNQITSSRATSHYGRSAHGAFTAP